MFKVFRRKSKKTISSPQKVRSQSTSAHHDSHGVAGIGDGVRPLSYHFGTNDDLESTAPQSRYSSVEFSSFRTVDDAPQSTRTVERKTSMQNPRDTYPAEFNGMQQASSMGDLLGDAPGNKQRRNVPCPPQRLSSLTIEDIDATSNGSSSPPMKAIYEVRQSSDYDSSSDVENKPPRTNGHDDNELRRGHSLSSASPPLSQIPLHQRNSPSTTNVPKEVKTRETATTDKAAANIRTGVQRRATLERLPALNLRDSDQEGLEVDIDLDLTSVTSLADNSLDNLSPNLSPVTSHVTTDSESESEPNKTQTFMESLMNSTAAALPPGSAIPFSANANKTATRMPATKSEEPSVLSFRDAMKKSRLNSQSSLNGPLSPISPTTPMPLLSMPSRSLSMSGRTNNPTPPPRKPRKGRTPKSPLALTQSFSLDHPSRGPMQRSASELSSISQASVSSDFSNCSSNGSTQESKPSYPLAITVSPANEGNTESSDILQDVVEPSTSLAVNRNSTYRTDSGISSVDLEELVVKDIHIDKPSNQEVMVEEDYSMMSDQELPTVEKLEPWEMSMAQAWDAAVGERTDEVFHEEIPKTKVKQLSSDDDEVSVVHDHVWQSKPPSSWTNDDIVQWCTTKEFGSLAELLADCGIDGEQFLVISNQDLADLHLNEETRKQVIAEIEQLRKQDHESFTYLKQVSIRRRNLEASNEALFDNLQSLQKLNTEQQESISSYLGELQQEQERTTHLLAEVNHVENDSRTLTRQVSQSMDDLSTDQKPSLTHRQASLTDVSKSDAELSLWRQLPLVKWAAADVHSWMNAVELERFLPAFSHHNITGKDLAQINMPLLDKLKIKAIEDRELILSKLYDLQHSFDEASSNRTSSPNSSLGRNSVASRARYEPSDIDESSQISDVEKVSPTNLCDVEVWHELRGAFDVTTVSIPTGATTEDLIESLLNQLNLIEDSNLYGLQSVTLDPRYPDATQGIERDESPLAIQKQWPKGAQMRLELQPHPEATIKITNQIQGMKPTTKSFRISEVTTCAAIVRLACRRFKCQLLPEDITLAYISPESDYTGSDYIIAKDTDIAVNLDVDHLHLREKHATSHHGHHQTGEQTHQTQLPQAIENFKEEINMLNVDVKERDRVIESLQQDKDEMERNMKTIMSKQFDVQKLQQTAEQREKSWQDKCHRLQRELDRLKKIESYADPKAKVQILEAELKEMTEQVNTQEKNRKHMHQAVNKKRSLVDGAPGDDKRLPELIAQLRKAEMTLLILKQEQDTIDVHLQLAKSHLEKKQQLVASGPPIYKSLASSSFNIVPCEIPLTSGSLGFLHGRDENGNLVVRHAEDKSSLKKGDRVLEVSGTIVSDVSDLEFSRLLRKATGKLELVVLRPVQQQTNLKEMQVELQGVKEDLALVVMDLDSAQLENQEMNDESKRLKKKLSTLESEREEFKLECVRISKQLAESERQKSELESKLLHAETSNNEGIHSNGDEGMPNGVLAYGELEVSVPLWQALSSSPQAMVLQALKDHILETTQQKAYLDHLISAVLQTNPEILSLIDQRVGLHDRKAMRLKASTEEFC